MKSSAEKNKPDMKELASKILALGGACFMYASQGGFYAEYVIDANRVIHDGVTVGETVYKTDAFDDDDIISERELVFDTLEEALQKFTVKSKPLGECGFEPEFIPPPGC